MPGTVKAEAVVLRSIRYSEADRVLHLYTPYRGRVGAIAKGVRKSLSRFGGRLEPFFHLRLVLHEGRGDLLTVTAAETVSAYPRLREGRATLDAAARACDAVARLFETGDPHPEVFHLLCNQLALLDADPRPGRAREPAGLPSQAPARRRARTPARRLRLVRRARWSRRLLRAAGGVVCAACEASAFPLDAEAHAFLVTALGSPLAKSPAASPSALRQAERAIVETAEHHAHVRLRPAA